jgi:hypothetical protein
MSPKVWTSHFLYCCSEDGVYLMIMFRNFPAGARGRGCYIWMKAYDVMKDLGEVAVEPNEADDLSSTVVAALAAERVIPLYTNYN